jgi:hypothetical protein
MYDSGVIANIIVVVVVVLFPGVDSIVLVLTNVERVNSTFPFAFPGRQSTFNFGNPSASNWITRTLACYSRRAATTNFTILCSKTRGVSSWAWRAWLAEHQDRRVRPPLWIISLRKKREDI